MCLTFFRLLPSPELDFLLCFNRDEATARLTLPLAPYEEDPNIIAGRDMTSKGSWLGVNIKTGILVFLTNFDTPAPFFGLSRGKLVYSILSTNFIPNFIPKGKSSDEVIEQFLKGELKRRLEYSPFNLVIFNINTEKMFYICSQLPQTEPRILQKAKPYGLCNSDIDTMWPKTAHGLSLFKNILAESQKQEGTKKIFEQLHGLCKDRKCFSEKKEDEASIFVQPYFDTVSKKERMTKSTFMCRIQSTANGKKITLREISYRQDLTEHVVDAQYTFGEKE